MESKVYIDPYPKTMKMLGLERINIDCGNNTSIVTPANIAEDMVAIVPDEAFIPESKFIDICIKSEIFLTSIRERLMNSAAMIEAIPDYKERYQYITNNQLYGIAPNGQCQMYSVRAVYGTLKVDNPHILCFGAFEQYKTACINNNHKLLIDEMKKEFGQMKFDVVIGNPPYSKGMDLDFVDLGYKLSNKYTVMITPAKWQTAANDYSGCASKNINYKQFREMYVPHMSYVCFYPDCVDVFNVSQSDGITYYILDPNLHAECTVENKCKINKYLNSCRNRNISDRQTLWNVANDIVEYLAQYKRFVFKHPLQAEYLVITNSQLANGGGARGGVGIFNNEGNFQCVGLSDIYTPQTQMQASGASCITFTSNSKDECESFISWLNTKFTRFFVAINISKLTGILTNDYFRFVPAPPTGKFDHIYTDQELYEAFDLPQKYRDVIEAVIKERK